MHIYYQKNPQPVLELIQLVPKCTLVFISYVTAMPMNCRARLPGLGMQPGVQEDIDCVLDIWNNCRNNFGNSGDMLFSHF